MANSSPDTGKSVESTAIIEIQKSTESTTMKESPGMTTSQNVVEPSRTETSKSSIDSEESEKSTATVKLQEFSGMATVQNVVEPSRTETSEKSDTTQTEEDMKTTETTEDPQSEGSQMDGESVPLNSRTGALVPVQDPSLTPSFYLQWLRSLLFYHPSQILGYVWSWVLGQASQTQDDETGKNLCKAKTEVIEMRNLQCDAGSNDDVDTNDDAYVVVDAEHVTEGMSLKENIDKIREIIGRTYSTYWWYFQTHHTVGIFSRSSESEYEWLTSVLRSQPFHNTVLTVRPHYISNNGRLQFMEAVSQCTFGILYHTRNRGRINIADVTDSLYDEELKYMSEHLGKENVIVVVDDLEDTSDKERTRILDAQPSIRELAKDIILFNATEKKSCDY